MRMPFGVGPPKPARETTSPSSSQRPTPASSLARRASTRRRAPRRRRRRAASPSRTPRTARARAVGGVAEPQAPGHPRGGARRPGARRSAGRRESRRPARARRIAGETIDLGRAADRARQLVGDRVGERLERPSRSGRRRPGCAAACGSRRRPPLPVPNDPADELGVDLGMSAPSRAARARLCRASSTRSKGRRALRRTASAPVHALHVHPASLRLRAGARLRFARCGSPPRSTTRSRAMLELAAARWARQGRAARERAGHPAQVPRDHPRRAAPRRSSSRASAAWTAVMRSRGHRPRSPSPT